MLNNYPIGPSHAIDHLIIHLYRRNLGKGPRISAATLMANPVVIEKLPAILTEANKPKEQEQSR